MQRKDSCTDVQWILEKLPTDIITTIILSYNPESLYILSHNTILGMIGGNNVQQSNLKVKFPSGSVFAVCIT